MNLYDKLRTWFEHYEGCFICRQSESASAPACETGKGAVLRHRALVAVENLAWMKADNEPIDPKTATVSEKAFLSLPSETKLDIEYILWGLTEGHRLDTDTMRRPMRTMALLAYSQGISDGLTKLANKFKQVIDEAVRAARKEIQH